MDLLTPNKLKLGRSSATPVSVTDNFSGIVKMNNQKIFNTWFERLLVNHVSMLLHHPKWFQSVSVDPRKCVILHCS